MPYLTKTQLIRMGFKKLGDNVRISNKASIYDADKIEIDDNSRIDDFCILSGYVSIGKFVHLAPMCLIAGGEKGVTMEDFSALAYGVKVFSQSDDYSGKAMTSPLVPKKYTRVTKRKIRIGKYAIIGTNSVIMPGGDVREGASVGAMSLVIFPTDSWAIYSGNPAVKIRERSRNLLILAAEFLKELEETGR